MYGRCIVAPASRGRSCTIRRAVRGSRRPPRTPRNRAKPAGHGGQRGAARPPRPAVQPRPSGTPTGTVRSLSPLPRTRTVRRTMIEMNQVRPHSWLDPDTGRVEQLRHGGVAQAHRSFGSLTHRIRRAPGLSRPASAAAVSSWRGLRKRRGASSASPAGSRVGRPPAAARRRRWTTWPPRLAGPASARRAPLVLDRQPAAPLGRPFPGFYHLAATTFSSSEEMLTDVPARRSAATASTLLDRRHRSKAAQGRRGQSGATGPGSSASSPASLHPA